MHSWPSLHLSHLYQCHALSPDTDFIFLGHLGMSVSGATFASLVRGEFPCTRGILYWLSLAELHITPQGIPVKSMGLSEERDATQCDQGNWGLGICNYIFIYTSVRWGAFPPKRRCILAKVISHWVLHCDLFWEHENISSIKGKNNHVFYFCKISTVRI